MRPRTRKLLCDALFAIDAVEGFVTGVSFDVYARQLLLQSGVERQLTILAEALIQFAREESDADTLIPLLPQIRGFRNLVIHEYGVVDDSSVWDIVKRDLPELRPVLQRLLESE